MFDFDQFLDRMARLSYESILREADREARGAERSNKSIRSTVQRRQSGGLAYVEKINAFIYFMRFGTRTSGVTDADFKKYRRVVVALIELGDMRPEALQHFD